MTLVFIYSGASYFILHSFHEAVRTLNCRSPNQLSLLEIIESESIRSKTIQFHAGVNEVYFQLFLTSPSSLAWPPTPHP